MVKKSDKKFWLDFRRFFLRGLATLLPTVLTIVLLVKCYEFIQENISVHLTEGVIHIVLLSTDDYPHPEDADYKDYKAEYKLEKIDRTNPAEVKEVRLWMLRQKWKRAPWSVIGFILAIILVYIVGRLLASFIGHKVWQLFEGTVQRIPGFKQVYPYIKQVTDYLFGENKVEFSRVVAVPYPRKGLWSLGLVTGAGFRSMHETADEEFLTVFIPSSPTPVTGYVIHVKKDEVIDVPITIEEALRFTVSGGVIVPGHEVLPTQRIELKSASRTARTEATDDEKEE